MGRGETRRELHLDNTADTDGRRKFNKNAKKVRTWGFVYEFEKGWLEHWIGQIKLGVGMRL